MTGTVPELGEISVLRGAEASCRTCRELELNRDGWIERYRDLLKQRKAGLLEGHAPSRELTQSLAQIETELKQAGQSLVEHCAVHSFIKNKQAAAK